MTSQVPGNTSSLAMVPYTGTPERSEFSRIRSETPLYRPIRTDIFFSISRGLLLTITDIRDAFLPNSVSSFDDLLVRLQVNPDPYSHCEIEIRDPKAKDLEACSRVFLQFQLYPNKTAFLSELAAPSFSGRKTMQIVWKLKELTGSSYVIFGDGSTQLPCDSHCTEDAMTSLRSMQVMKSGMSWYEMQGASSCPFSTFHDYFNPHIEEAYAESLEESKKEHPFGSESPWDYDRFRYHALTSIENFFIAPEVYRSAKNFLYEFSVNTAKDIFEALNDHLRIQGAHEILDRAMILVDSKGQPRRTIGDIFRLSRGNASQRYWGSRNSASGVT